MTLVLFTRPGVTFVVLGKPAGKGRPRFGNGRTYTDAATEAAEARIERAWEQAGKQRIDGPVRVDVRMYLARPKSHWRKDGALTAEGERTPWPCRKPDVDNALKLILDALNTRAYRDDADVISAVVGRNWASRLEPENTVITIEAA